MSERFESQSPQEDPENVAKKEIIEKINQLRETFATAERAFVESGREAAKAYLPEICTTLIKLNKFDPEVVFSPLAQWNPEADISENEFDELNRRRKILSNAVGIMTASGQIRHDLNPGLPESLE